MLMPLWREDALSHCVNDVSTQIRLEFDRNSSPVFLQRLLEGGHPIIQGLPERLSVIGYNEMGEEPNGEGTNISIRGYASAGNLGRRFDPIAQMNCVTNNDRALIGYLNSLEEETPVLIKY